MHEVSTSHLVFDEMTKAIPLLGICRRPVERNNFDFDNLSHIWATSHVHHKQIIALVDLERGGGVATPLSKNHVK